MNDVWTELNYDDAIGPELSLIEFHDAMGIPVNNSPTRLYGDDLKPRLKIINEEWCELCEALDEDSKAEHVLKEMADLLYTIYSLSVSTGFWPYLEEAFYRVHESNMTKVDPETGQVQYKNGKVLKGPHYQSPNFDDMNVKYPDES